MQGGRTPRTRTRCSRAARDGTPVAQARWVAPGPGPLPDRRAFVRPGAASGRGSPIRRRAGRSMPAADRSAASASDGSADPLMCATASISSSIAWASALIVIHAGARVSRLAMAARDRATVVRSPEIAISDGYTRISRPGPTRSIRRSGTMFPRVRPATRSRRRAGRSSTFGAGRRRASMPERTRTSSSSATTRS